MHPRYVQALLSSIEARLRGDFEPGHRFDPYERQLHRLTKSMEAMMATLDETLAKVTEQGDRLDSLLAFVSGLKKQLEEALAGQLTPEMQAKIDAIFTEAEENRAKIDEALNVNVPPPPVP